MGLCLNPFGTGKVFKRNIDSYSVKYISLNPFGTGKVFKQARVV